MDILKFKPDLEAHMNSRFLNLFLSILFLIIISLFSYGGCDIKFGGSGGNDGNNSDFETVEGTVIDISPTSITIDGTFVVVNDDPRFSADLDESGEFSIEGLFSGASVRLDFREQLEPPSFATAFLNVYRGATLQLGNIEIVDGDVMIDTIVTNFDATVIMNNCSGNSGTLEVQTLDDDPDVFVIVSITSTTDIEDGNGNPASCEDIIGEVFIRGILEQGNNVEAGRIELQ